MPEILKMNKTLSVCVQMLKHVQTLPSKQLKSEGTTDHITCIIRHMGIDLKSMGGNSEI